MSAHLHLIENLYLYSAKLTFLEYPDEHMSFPKLFIVSLVMLSAT